MCARRCLCMHSGQGVQMYHVCMIYRLLHNVQARVQFVFSFAECVGLRGRDKWYGNVLSCAEDDVEVVRIQAMAPRAVGGDCEK